ncbi:MAG: T9SS type A sorting domain-containing protein [Bacteroidetes bacterium]|nr:T9SS type A sorting domain-containing protein [Bacteroidota bacterium]
MRHTKNLLLISCMSALFFFNANAQIAPGWPTKFQKFYTQKWDGSIWETATQNSPAFNTDKSIRSVITKEKKNITFELSGRDTFIYTNTRLTQVIRYTWIFGKWNNSQRTTISYNTAGRVSFKKIDLWSSSTWNPSYIDSNVYDNTGKLIREVLANYNGKTYTNSNQKYYSYDLKARVAYKENVIWSAGKWVKSTREVFTYNTTGQLTDIKLQQYAAGAYNDAYNTNFEYETTTAVEDVAVQNNEFKFYPNPCSGNLNVALPQDNTSYNVSLFDVQGKLMLSQKVEANDLQMDISTLKNGIYILQCSNGEKMQTGRIVKN